MLSFLVIGGLIIGSINLFSAAKNSAEEIVKKSKRR